MYFNDQLAREGAGQILVRDVRRAKAVALLMQRVTIEDLDGNPLTHDHLDGAGRSVKAEAPQAEPTEPHTTAPPGTRFAIVSPTENSGDALADLN